MAGRAVHWNPLPQVLGRTCSLVLGCSTPSRVELCDMALYLNATYVGFSRNYSRALEKINVQGPMGGSRMGQGCGSLHHSPVVCKSGPRPSTPLCARFPTRALFPALAPLCAGVVVHTLKLLFSSFNNILQLISCFLADSLSKSNLWQVLIWVMTNWSTFLVGNYWVRSEQIWYPLTVSKGGFFTTRSLEIRR